MKILKILVVDDEPMLAELIAMLIAGESIEPSWCTSPADALALSKLQKFDFIVSDIAMPDMNGMEMVKAWHALHGNAPPVIFVTGHTHIKTPQIEGVEVLACLSKPVQDRELTYLIENYAKK